MSNGATNLETEETSCVAVDVVPVASVSAEDEVQCKYRYGSLA